jgi:hypothetical protein
MDLEAFEDTARRRVIARLRDAHGIPWISLFYI